MSEGPTIRSMAELLIVMRARRDELKLTHETIDDISLLPDGYTSKLLAPIPMRNLGPKSFEQLLEALGLVLIVAKDPSPSGRVRTKWENKRELPLRNQSALSLPSEVPKQIAVTPALQRLLENPNWMKEIGARGGKTYWARLTPEQRSRVIKRRWKMRRVKRRAADFMNSRVSGNL